FADAHLADMSDEDLSEFERLLSTPDWEVYAWRPGRRKGRGRFVLRRGPAREEEGQTASIGLGLSCTAEWSTMQLQKSGGLPELN
ncbi:MAG: succinate dehydrogenase assembly factor 2, partial [Pseudomonadota bacterium]